MDPIAPREMYSVRSSFTWSFAPVSSRRPACRRPPRAKNPPAPLAAFGDRGAIEREVTAIRTDTVKLRQRRTWVGELRQDIVVGLRGLRRAPAFTLVAVLTLALGIGANTAIFSVLHSVLLRPLPYPDGQRLIQLWSDHRARGRAQPEWLTPPDYADWRDGNHTFASMTAYQGWGPDLTGTGDPETLAGLAVSGNYFDVLGIKPAVGHGFTMADDDAGAEPVVMLSYALWTRRFASDSTIVGRHIVLNGLPWTVVGVLPSDFRAPLGAASPDVFRPMRRPPNNGCGRDCVVLRAIGRLKPGVTFASAQADLATIAARAEHDYPATNAKVGAWLIPLQQQLTSNVRPALLALGGAVGFVLLIGCVNLANLLLVRGAARRRELAVRAALGAGKGRIARQLLTETAMLALAGGTLGAILGVFGSRVLASAVPDSVRRVQEIRVDGTVLVFAAVVTIASAALFGLLPTYQATRASLANALRSGARETGFRAALLRSGLVVAQLSLAVVLLVGAGLFLRSFLYMQRSDLGYRSEGVSLTAVSLPPARYPKQPAAVATIEALLARLRTDPAVKSAELTDLPPLTAGDQDITAIPVGEPERSDLPPSIWYRSVTPGYLSTMHMRLTEGRMFTVDDRAGGSPVGIVNAEAARLFWPGKSPIGHVLAQGRGAGAPQLTIVGVVASARHDGPNQPYKPELFLPWAQMPATGVTIVLEPARVLDVAAITAAYRRAVREIDPLLPVSKLDSIDQLLGDAVALPRLYTTLVGIFAVAALLLAALGVYGVMAYAVLQRQREIGVRLALGAAPSRIAAMVLGEGGRLAIIGLLIGGAAGLALAQALRTLLFGVDRFAAPTVGIVAAVLAVMTLAASWLPARRAMRLDPLVAIRDE